MPKGVPNKRYTAEFKQKVIEDMRKNNLGYREAEIKYGISAHGAIQKWERIYLEEGFDGLCIERRGRASKGDSPTKGRPPKMGKRAEEDLIAEVQRLRMENAYLKKLNALVQQREESETKTRLR
jgi:transposase